ncbi:MAG: IS200/IS605 family transposase [Bacilli bacterium]|nr:IS200/IS605 family transposase [Bacilli bacterium]MDD4643813.1 IS200/IS605 family transposase [Bacilli bacterium]
MFKQRDIDENQLSHTNWNCQYHMVFTPKFRKKAIYGKLRRGIGIILRRLCEYKGIEIVEANACSDHIHMLVRIPPKISISSFMEYLKGKSCLMIYENHANLKYKYGNRNFGAKGYYISTVELNKATIKKYIREQETEDILLDKRSVKEY